MVMDKANKFIRSNNNNGDGQTEPLTKEELNSECESSFFYFFSFFFDSFLSLFLDLNREVLKFDFRLINSGTLESSSVWTVSSEL